MALHGTPQLPRTGPVATAEPFRTRLSEISMFFQGNDAVHQTMRRVAAALQRDDVDTRRLATTTRLVTGAPVHGFTPSWV